MTKSPAELWTSMAAAAVDATLSPYGAGLRDFPSAAFSDPYVLGFVNSLLLSVIDKCIGNDGPFEFREQLLQRSQKLVHPQLAQSLKDFSPGLLSFSDDSYLLGIEHGELCADVVDGNFPLSEPEILQSARRLVHAASHSEDDPAAAVGGALVVLTLYRRVKDLQTVSVSQPSSVLGAEEFAQAMALGIQDAELGAALNIERRKDRMVENAQFNWTKSLLPLAVFLVSALLLIGVMLQR